jgi:hypothetical protein
MAGFEERIGVVGRWRGKSGMGIGDRLFGEGFCGAE